MLSLDADTKTACSTVHFWRLWRRNIYFFIFFKNLSITMDDAPKKEVDRKEEYYA